MGKIVCLMGKSSTGKDTIYKKILEGGEIGFQRIIPYTTRPIRVGEVDGREYHFVEEDDFRKLKEEGKIIEDREYHTIHGLWRYFTVDDGGIKPEENYLLIGTLEAYLQLRDYFGTDRLVPVLIELNDGVRLQRALTREMGQKQPKYEEMCRRFLADSADFSEEKIEEAGILTRFENNDLDRCTAEIVKYLKANL